MWYLAIVVAATIMLYYELYIAGAVSPSIIAGYGMTFPFYVYISVVGNAVGAFDQQFGGATQQRGALVSRCCGGLRLGFDGRIERVVKVSERRMRRMGDDRIPIGIAHLVGRGRGAPFASDQHWYDGWLGFGRAFRGVNWVHLGSPGCGKTGLDCWPYAFGRPVFPGAQSTTI